MHGRRMSHTHDAITTSRIAHDICYANQEVRSKVILISYQYLVKNRKRSGPIPRGGQRLTSRCIIATFSFYKWRGVWSLPNLRQWLWLCQKASLTPCQCNWHGLCFWSIPRNWIGFALPHHIRNFMWVLRTVRGSFGMAFAGGQNRPADLSWVSWGLVNYPLNLWWKGNNLQSPSYETQWKEIENEIEPRHYRR
jgi:hypothetical protein